VVLLRVLACADAPSVPLTGTVLDGVILCARLEPLATQHLFELLPEVQLRVANLLHIKHVQVHVWIVLSKAPLRHLVRVKRDLQTVEDFFLEPRRPPHQVRASEVREDSLLGDIR
jgi:hypothetical protein